MNKLLNLITRKNRAIVSKEAFNIQSGNLKRKWELNRGFTLIELMVVVAIIMILISILLPALRQAKNKTLQIVCTNNQKQMGVVMLSYIDKYDGWFPPCYLQAPDRGWCDFLTYSDLIDLSQMSSKEAGYNATGICVCPASKYRFYWQPVNYTYPQAAGMLKTDGTPYDVHTSLKKIATVPIPCSEAPLLGDAEVRASTVDYPYHTYYDFSRYYHFNPTAHSGMRANILFVDGHVEFRKVDVASLSNKRCRWQQGY